MNFQEEIEKETSDTQRNVRKLILIENIDDLNMTKEKRNKFIRFYYNNLDMNLLEALDEFKKI